MYLRAQPLFFWPNLVADINHFVKDCESCALVNFKALSNQTVAWPSTAAPWKRIHLDFFFFKNVIYLILVDSYSRWIEVWPVQNTSADLVIDKLRSVIATFGLFDQVVTDNGPPFDSFDFLQFCTKNNIIVTKSPPYHPQSNGSVERAGQTAKQGLKKLCLSTTDVPMRDRLYNFLFQYRNTPCKVTGESPAAIMFSFPVRTPLSVVKPPSRPTYVPNIKSFSPGEEVLVRFEKGKPLVQGVVRKAISSVLYLVEIAGKVVQVHVNQAKLGSLNKQGEAVEKTTESPESPRPVMPTPVSPTPRPIQNPEVLVQIPEVQNPGVPVPIPAMPNPDRLNPVQFPKTPQIIPVPDPQIVPRRSPREPKPIQRLNL